jgi:hypothetical protein
MACKNGFSGVAQASRCTRPPAPKSELSFPTKAQFARWLKEQRKHHGDDHVIAIAWHTDDCPLARFLMDIGVSERPYVSPSLISSSGHLKNSAVWRCDDRDTGCMPLPRWADSFARAIDRVGMRRRSFRRQLGSYGPVTVRDCLDVIEGRDLRQVLKRAA